VGTLKQREGRMTFVEMTHVWLDSERCEQSPAAHPEHDFLFEA